MNVIAIRSRADVDGGWFHRRPSYRSAAPRAVVTGKDARA
jgi:hypothetical protein